MRIATYLTILAAPLVLAACNGSEEAAETEDSTMAGAPGEDMPMTGETPMAPAGEAGRTASGEGSVTAINADAGTITIDHGAIEAVDWPAMTMAFSADEAKRASVAVGDKVAFEFRTTEGGGELISITKM